jgi:hypothetical protein
MTPGMCRPQPHHVVLSKKKFVSMRFVDVFGGGMDVWMDVWGVWIYIGECDMDRD